MPISITIYSKHISKLYCGMPFAIDKGRIFFTKEETMKTQWDCRYCPLNHCGCNDIEGQMAGGCIVPCQQDNVEASVVCFPVEEADRTTE